MRRKKTIVLFFLSLICFVACDDNTGTLGNSVTPPADSINVSTHTFYAESHSLGVDSVLGKTDKVLLGRFTDSLTNSMFEADFMAQLNCMEGGNLFPKKGTLKGDTAARTELKLYFRSFFGDSTATMKVEVYELLETLKEGEKYYTNIEPKLYCDLSLPPVASAYFTPIDYTLDDEEELENDEHYANVNIPLPNSIGNRIISEYYRDSCLFDNATSFIENICKGYYVTCTQGEGAIIYVDQVALNVYFDNKSNDSTYVTQFVGSPEVLQTNRFTTNYTDDLLDEDNAKAYTYLKTPAGIFTEVTLPVDDIAELVEDGDSINSAKIIFSCLNETEEVLYDFGVPQKLLMVRKYDLLRKESGDDVDLVSFFEKNKLVDNITSFYSTFDSNYNRYVYGNIAKLMVCCNNERLQWMEENGKSEEDYAAMFPDWNKVVLVPVTTITDSNGSVVNFRHDFSLNSTRLVGGTDSVVVRVITSKFNR